MADEEKNWERETLEKLSFAALKEQRKARRWGIFFKLLTFAYVTFLLILVYQWRGTGDIISDGNHTALVELEGVIDAKGDASAEKINSALQSAFKDKNNDPPIHASGRSPRGGRGAILSSRSRRIARDGFDVSR